MACNEAHRLLWHNTVCFVACRFDPEPYCGLSGPRPSINFWRNLPLESEDCGLMTRLRNWQGWRPKAIHNSQLLCLWQKVDSTMRERAGQILLQTVGRLLVIFQTFGASIEISLSDPTPSLLGSLSVQICCVIAHRKSSILIAFRSSVWKSFTCSWWPCSWISFSSYSRTFVSPLFPLPPSSLPTPIWTTASQLTSHHPKAGRISRDGPNRMLSLMPNQVESPTTNPTSTRTNRSRVDSRWELSQLLSDHIFSDPNLHIVLSIMNMEPQADKVWKDGAGASVCSDWDIGRGVAEGEGDDMGS